MEWNWIYSTVFSVFFILFLFLSDTQFDQEGSPNMESVSVVVNVMSKDKG